MFFNERDRKGMDANEKRGREKLGGVWGGKTIIRINSIKKSIFSKRKKSLGVVNSLIHLDFYNL